MTEAAPVRPRTSRRAYLAVGAVVVALGFLVLQGLGNATVYFRTADEAVAQKESLGTRRFRVEGAVVPHTTRSVGDLVHFRIRSNGVSLAVVHRGDPPELFKDGIPVVLEGHWAGDHFASDRIMVKHSSEYIADHRDRLQRARADTKP